MKGQSCVDIQAVGATGINTACNDDFWYSKNAVVASLAFLFLLVQSISVLIPPFQSPDETHHLKRAYLLSKGDVFLGKENGITGGEIDTGLLNYMRNFEHPRWFTYDDDERRKQREPRVSLAKTMMWSGTREFTPVRNVAVYFPLPYLPQALAFSVGEYAGVSVSTSYYLARLFSLIATLGLIWAASRLYPVPIFVAALFVTPMTLFQLASASLDSVSFATCTLAASLFMRGANIKYPFSSGMHVTLLVCLFSLATSRINLIVLTLLPAALHAARRTRLYLASTAVVFLLSIAWIMFVLTTVRTGPSSYAPASAEAINYYLNDSASFFTVLFNTITNSHLLQSYWYMFIGAFGWAGIEMAGEKFVGWHGIFLDSSIYLAWGILLTLLVLVSLERHRTCLLSRGSLSLACGAALSLFLLFPILMAAWVRRPADIIEGVQGRYFTPIVILLSFSVFSRRLSLPQLRAGLLIIFLMTAISIAGMATKLLLRYWLNEL